MILNTSRIKTWFTCRRKAFDTYHRHLSGDRRSMNLVDGGAVHAGIASGLATHDWREAKVQARAKFDLEIQEATILPEEEYLREAHWQVIDKILDVFEQAFDKESYRVLQPEAEFLVEIPGTEHNDITMHWMDREHVEHWGAPSATDIVQGVFSPHNDLYDVVDATCACYQPHKFTGKTDAIVLWNNNIWLLEHKTTSIAGQQFWSQWQLDIQPTAYIYGISRAGMPKPSGFILNALIKPSEAQVASYNKRRKYGEPSTQSDYIKYEREAFLRSDEDLARVERQITAVANDWERAITLGVEEGFYMSPVPGACTSYNRLCDFYSACLAHDDDASLNALAQRPLDYVDDARLVQIQGARDAKTVV
jgi:hypothetical protein